MAGEITSSINTTVANPKLKTDATSWTNPNGILEKDDFLKLLLVELKYQDPTSPMETDKMLSQTADLTVVEANTAMKDSIESLANQMKATSSYSLIDTVGKVADTGNDSVKFNFQGKSTDIEIYFKEAPLSGNFQVYDSQNRVIRTIALTKSEINHLKLNNSNTFTWDGKDDNGIPVTSGSYRIGVEYTGSVSKKNMTAKPGIFPIESVKLSSGTPQLKLGETYYTLDQIKEIKQSF